MSENANSVPAPKLQSRRCFACRLPAELREEIERDRIRHWKTFDQLAQDLAGKGFRVGPASVRRHFGHIARDSQFETAETEHGNPAEVPTLFDTLVGSEAVDDRAIADAMVRVLVDQLHR